MDSDATIARLICVLRLRSDDKVHGRALFQSDLFAHSINQSVSNRNSLTRIVSTLNGNLNFLGVARIPGRNDFLHGLPKEENSVNDHNSSPNRVPRSISSPARIVGTP
jgi:hypothetical protein